MVRLRREIEGLKRDHSKRIPDYLQSQHFRTILDEMFADAIRQLDWEKGGRVLAVSPPLFLARELLKEASHLTIVESDSERASVLTKGLSDVADVRTLTIHEKVYSEISFERSAFDLILSLDDLNAYFSPGNAVRKYGRELKVSGVFFGRIVLTEESCQENKAGRWAVSQFEFEKESNGGFRLDSVERVLASAMLVSKLSDRLPQLPVWALRKMFQVSAGIDSRLSKRALSQVPAISYIHGGKALGFGSVFQVNK